MHKLHGETSVYFQEGKLFEQSLQSMNILIRGEFFSWFLMAVFSLVEWFAKISSLFKKKCCPFV